MLSLVLCRFPWLPSSWLWVQASSDTPVITPTHSYVCYISVQQYLSFDRVVPCLKKRDKTISASEAFLARALARKKYKMENLPDSKGSRWEKLFRACLNMLLRNLFKDFPGFLSDTAMSLDTCHIDMSMPAMTETRGDTGSIPGSGRSLGVGNGNPLQYSCLENPVDRGAWWTTVHGVAEQLSRHAHLQPSG